MDQNDKKDQTPTSVEEVAIHGMALTEALYEILRIKVYLRQWKSLPAPGSLQPRSRQISSAQASGFPHRMPSLHQLNIELAP